MQGPPLPPPKEDPDDGPRTPAKRQINLLQAFQAANRSGEKLAKPSEKTTEAVQAMSHKKLRKILPIDSLVALEKDLKNMREFDSISQLAKKARHELVSKTAAGELVDPALRGHAVSRGLKAIGRPRGSLLMQTPTERKRKQRAFGGPALR